MWDLSHFRKHHASVQGMPRELVELHIGVPYFEQWSHVFNAIIVSCVLLHLGQALYARRTQATVRRCQTQSEVTCCSVVLWVQLCYLIFYLARTALLGKERWEFHFPLGLTWISIFDGIN